MRIYILKYCAKALPCRMTDIDDKIKAGAKAVANKVDDAYRDLKTDYRKEKIKQELD